MLALFKSPFDPFPKAKPDMLICSNIFQNSKQIIIIYIHSNKGKKPFCTQPTKVLSANEDVILINPITKKARYNKNQKNKTH